jgi:hypothetical protein
MVTFEQKKYYLLVTSGGVRTNLAAVVESAGLLNEIALKSPTPFMLLDYRNVKFKIPLTHANDLMRLHESKMEDLKNVTMAVVIKRSERKIAELWKEVSEKRGLWFTLFEDFNEAEDWLTEQAKLVIDK